MSSWFCDGIPKNGQHYPQAVSHPPQENYGSNCTICNLPQEAMQNKTRQVVKTTLAGGGAGSTGKRGFPLIPFLVWGLVCLGLGLFTYILLKPKPPNNPSNQTTVNPSPPTSGGDFVSSQAKNSQLFSQGEKILLKSTPDKETASSAFAQKDWQKAIADFASTATPEANDPEAKIYFHNAQARQAGNPLTIAVVVPVSSDPNGSQEILRGVAKFQEEFWQTQPAKPLEVVIVNDVGQLKSAEIAGDLLQNSRILGVLGHGIDPFSQQAIRRYQDGGMPILSPLTTSISEGAQPTLKTIGLEDKNSELLANYLKSVGNTLAQYAKKQKPLPKAVIFYNSDSSYSRQLQEQFTQALQKNQGRVIETVDTSKADFQATVTLDRAKKQGANVILLAMNKAPEQIERALAIAQANLQGGSPALLLGGNELYNPDILLKGKEAIANLVLAVPWSFQPSDPFAQDAVKSWKGRVSWRTATAYDATKTLTAALEKSPERRGATQVLQSGIPLSGNSSNFNLFNEVPLVRAVRGSSGPAGSKYQFEPVK